MPACPLPARYPARRPGRLPIASSRLFVLLASLLPTLTCAAVAGCGGPAGPAGSRESSALSSFQPPQAVNHLEAVFPLVESPPADVETAWKRLAFSQPEAEQLFFPGWAPERRSIALRAGWQRIGGSWEDLRVGLYRLDNRFAATVAAVARDVTRAYGSLPAATVHLCFVPDPRAGAAALVEGRGTVVLNAAMLALAAEAELERELIRQLAVLAVLQRQGRAVDAGAVAARPAPPTLAGLLLLEAQGAWAVRTVRPQSLEAETVGATAEQFRAAQEKLVQVRDQLAGQLDSSAPAVLDRWLVHGDGDLALPRAARLAAFTLQRAVVRDALPSEVLALRPALFRSRAVSMWAAEGGATAAPGAPAAAPGGALVESRSKAEEAIAVRGAKTRACVGPFTTDGPAISLDLPGGSWVRRGARLDGALGEGPATLGYVGDIKAADEETLANLAQFVAEFRKAGVTAVLVAGDLAETREGMQTVLTALAAVEVPLLVIPGNREGQARYRQALAVVGPRHPNIVDMTNVRLVDTPRFAVVSLPGYYDPRFVHARDGCVYEEADVQALLPIAAAAKGKPVVLLAHSPPRGQGIEAIDWADAGANVGDPAIAKVLQRGAFAGGVYANLHEAGGRAVRSDLQTRVRRDSWEPDLHLVTGSANAMPWPMLDGRVGNGMAGLLEIKGGKLRYQVLFAKR